MQPEEVLQEWRQTAKYWKKHSDTIRTMFMPLTQALIEEAAIVQGHSVLDVAGGSGEPSLTIAETVGANGSVMCTDAVAEMVDAARSAAQRRALTNVRFQQCTADQLPFDDETFDVAVCRLGVMFFPDPIASLREMLRVIKPDATLALVVWGRSELNPFCNAVTGVLERHFETAPDDPNAPGAFRFAESGALIRILGNAGAREVRERILNFHITAPISLQQFWELRSETSGTLRQKLATLPKSQVNQIARESQESLREYFPNNEMNIPAQMIIVSGKK